MLLALILSGAQAGASDRYAELTRATPHCEARSSDDEVVVCGRREADRYRVPLITVDPGDPAHEGVMAERERLLARTTQCREHTMFLVGCGMAGVGVSTRGGFALGGERPIAP